MSGRVYIIRAMGHFNQQNVLKEIGVKTVDNVMKGVQY